VVAAAASVPQSIDLVVQRRVPPAERLAADRRLLSEMIDPGRTSSGVLRVEELCGSVLSLGRYHFLPEGGAGPTAIARRLSGGRAVPAGDGFVGVSLVLPHRSALLATDPFALTPAQVMNRYVRGILEGCKLAGVAAFYPGLDAITVGGRTLGLVSFEVDAHGALLFESILAVGDDFSRLPALLDAVDPSGTVAARLQTPDETTSLACELGRAPSLDELAAWIRQGYEARLDVRCVERSLDAAMCAAADDRAWLETRRRRPTLARRGSVASLLGVFEAHFALADDRIEDLVFTGDFLADSAGIARLEAALRGCAAERVALERIVHAVYADPRHFILGIGPVTTVVDAILRGVPS
jgi:lipoate-protein ligase A